MIFIVLIDDANRGAIFEDATCDFMMGEWSRSIVQRYKDLPGGLLHPSCKAELLAIALLLRRETAQIVAGRASIRRDLFVNSVQAHGVLFEHVSAQRTTQLLRA